MQDWKNKADKARMKRIILINEVKDILIFFYLLFNDIVVFFHKGAGRDYWGAKRIRQY